MIRASDGRRFAVSSWRSTRSGCFPSMSFDLGRSSWPGVSILPKFSRLWKGLTKLSRELDVIGLTFSVCESYPRELDGWRTHAHKLELPLLRMTTNCADPDHAPSRPRLPGLEFLDDCDRRPRLFCLVLLHRSSKICVKRQRVPALCSSLRR